MCCMQVDRCHTGQVQQHQWCEQKVKCSDHYSYLGRKCRAHMLLPERWWQGRCLFMAAGCEQKLAITPHVHILWDEGSSCGSACMLVHRNPEVTRVFVHEQKGSTVAIVTDQMAPHANGCFGTFFGGPIWRCIRGPHIMYLTLCVLSVKQYLLLP